MMTSLLFLSDSDRAAVWRAVDAGEIPYPVNGVVPTMLVEWCLAGPTPICSFPDGDGHKIATNTLHPHRCTCTKPWGRPHEPCESCRGNVAVGATTEYQQSQADADHDKRANKPTPAAMEFRRWVCSKRCGQTWCNAMSEEKWPHGRNIGDRAEGACRCRSCGAPWEYIACDAEGREIGAGKRRYFRAAPELFWEFSERYPRGACYTKVFRNLHPSDGGLKYCISTYEELHGADAKHAADVAEELDALLEPKR